jgi:hypothetical protein
MTEELLPSTIPRKITEENNPSMQVIRFTALFNGKHGFHYYMRVCILYRYILLYISGAYTHLYAGSIFEIETSILI